MAEYKLAQIPPDVIDQCAPLFTPYLERAGTRGHAFVSVASEYDKIRARQKQLWAVVIPDEGHKVVCAATSHIETYDDGSKEAVIDLLGGDNMKLWSDLLSQFETWAKDDENCATVRFEARKGWAGVKFMKDYRITHYVMRKEL